MDHAILAGKEFYECTKVCSAHDLPSVDLTDLDILGQVSDHLNCAAGSIAVARTDNDGAIVLDIDSGSSLLNDPSDHLATWPDHRTNLVNRYLY